MTKRTLKNLRHCAHSTMTLTNCYCIHIFNIAKCTETEILNLKPAIITIDTLKRILGIEMNKIKLNDVAFNYTIKKPNPMF